MHLSKPQAAEVYAAMARLNNVNGVLHARILSPGGMTIHVQEFLTDEINVWVGDRPGNPVGPVERYANQHEFATAYGVSGS